MFSIKLKSLFLIQSLLHCMVCTVCGSSEGHRYEFDYIIIGAGPAGLQLGYFLKTAGRDYVILEKANISGDFFSRYPRHDTLISINKRHTGQTNKEFNLRHDWNSLLSHDESLLMRHYSKKMFPPRESYLKYLNDYEKKLGINVRHNVEVDSIRDKMPEDRSVHMNDQHANTYKCKYLIVATGLWVPNKPGFPGSEHVIGYEDVSTNIDDFEGKSVLILGNGNSAFEIADHIYGSTNVVHIAGRSRIKLSWQTHYVGDLRAVNNGLLDTYQLKSLDAALETHTPIGVTKLENGKYEAYFYDPSEPLKNYEDDYDNLPTRKSYDMIIRAVGWKFDTSIFNNRSQLYWSKQGKHKYPGLFTDYRVYNFENVYLAGTASHSLDAKKSAGGFIHGFRYTARTLHHIMEYKHHKVPWPHLTANIDQLVPIILKRLNEASGTYQMFSILCDVVLIQDGGQKFTYYEEFPVKLIQRFHEYTGCEKATRGMIVIVFEYGTDFSAPGADVFRRGRANIYAKYAHRSNFLHPVLYYYSTPPTIKQVLEKDLEAILPKPDRIHHISEDFLTEFDGYKTHLLPLRRYIEYILDADMRTQFAEECQYLTLTHTSVPPGCKPYLRTPTETDTATGTIVIGQHMWESPIL